MRDRDRDHGHEDDDENDRVHDRQLLPTLDVVEDEDRQRRLSAGGERGHNHLVERKRKSQETPGDKRRREHGPDHPAEGLPAVRSQVHRCLDQRRRAASQAREHVVVDDHDAEGRVPGDDRPDRKLHAAEVEERVQGHAGDDPRQSDRQQQQERDGLAAEEAEPVDRRGGRGP